MLYPADMMKLIGCKEHNLQDVDVEFPVGKLTVIVGQSGSGKSSLAFDTLFAEAQRRYVECLSPRVRMGSAQLPIPNLDKAIGLHPALGVSQTKQRAKERGIVSTDADPYLLLAELFVKLGTLSHPHLGHPLSRYHRPEMVEKVIQEYKEGDRLQVIAPVVLAEQSITEAVEHLRRQGYIRLRLNGQEIDPEQAPPEESTGKLEVVVDRIVIKEGVRDRLYSSISTACELGGGVLRIQEGKKGSTQTLSELHWCEETQESFLPLELADFRYWTPRGWCPVCRGEGTDCPTCEGLRLKPEALACRIEGKNLMDLLQCSVTAIGQELKKWSFEGVNERLFQEFLPEIFKRLNLLEEVGLSYLQLNRPSQTVSEGEAQRVQLASALCADLSGVLYVLDEPTLGLHAQDAGALLNVLYRLRDAGNTLVVVEHNPIIIQGADHLIEVDQGRVRFKGTYKQILKQESATGPWLSGKKVMPKPEEKPTLDQFLPIGPITLHNLKKLKTKLPLEALTGLCGVSGSGKSTLAIDVIADQFAKITTDSPLKRCIVVNQEQAGLSPRSFPATYVDLMTPIRNLFVQTPLARARGYTPAHFSLNRRGGRCEACQGLGEVKINLDWMPAVMVPCDLCHGKRYNPDTLQVLWNGHSLADILSFTASQALQVLHPVPRLRRILALMEEMGLGYITLGQPFATLSGGERQRLKLVADLAKLSLEPTLYILDEPSAGLHFDDVESLLKVLHRLIEHGHTVLCIEHHLRLLEQCDWLIELGPEAGPKGGQVVYEGPAHLIRAANTPTSRALASTLLSS